MTCALELGPIVDPSPLSALSSLKVLDLSGNQIRVLSPSFRVPSLSTLNLSSNGLTELAALSGLSFPGLDLAHNRLADLSALAGVTFVNIGCCLCADMPGSLDLSDNQIRDLSPLLAAVFAQAFAIDLRQNSVPCEEQAGTIDSLRAGGVTLSLDCP